MVRFAYGNMLCGGVALGLRDEKREMLGRSCTRDEDVMHNCIPFQTDYESQPSLIVEILTLPLPYHPLYLSKTIQ